MSNDQIEQFKRKFNHYCNQYDQKLNQYPIFQKIQESTNVRPSHVVLFVIILLTILAFLNLAPNAITNIIGFVHPAYYSFYALQTKTDEDDRQWLTYWIVFAFFNVVESVTDVLFTWIPFYYLVKCLIIIWLSHPTYRGAAVMLGYLAPIFQSLKNIFDPQPQPQTLGDAIKSIKKDVKKDLNNLSDKVNNIDVSFLNKDKMNVKFD